MGPDVSAGAISDKGARTPFSAIAPAPQYTVMPVLGILVLGVQIWNSKNGTAISE